MADPTSADTTTQEPQSIWRHKFNITSIKVDPMRWNKEWEKALHTMSPQDVYMTMEEKFLQAGILEPAKLSELSQGVKDVLCESQEGVVKLWDDLLEKKFEYFKTAWILLDEKECTRHLLTGLEEVCQQVSLGEDARTLCPEITISSMLKQRGGAFADFIDDYCKRLKDASAGQPLFFRSNSWDKALQDMPQSSSDTLEPSALTLLTLVRNEFIGEFNESSYMCTRKCLHGACLINFLF
jgi:hypothetical protein